MCFDEIEREQLKIHWANVALIFTGCSEEAFFACRDECVDF